jgi:hypothetical protein
MLVTTLTRSRDESICNFPTIGTFFIPKERKEENIFHTILYQNKGSGIGAFACKSDLLGNLQPCNKATIKQTNNLMYF